MRTVPPAEMAGTMPLKTFGKRNKSQSLVIPSNVQVPGSSQVEKWWKQKPSNCVSEFKKARKQPASSYHQLYLDLGQKASNRATQCQQCGFFYTKGNELDEKLHHSVHQERYNHKVRWPVKDNSVSYVKEYKEGMVWMDYACGISSSSNIGKSVNLLLSLSEEELGKDNTFLQNEKIQVYVYIARESWDAVGIVLVEPTCLENNTSNYVGCGIRRIWIARPFRRKQVATKLLETIRMTFIPGILYSKAELYFGEPLTEDCKNFARTYTECDCFKTYLPN